jgi:hypothetical protein
LAKTKALLDQKPTADLSALQNELKSLTQRNTTLESENRRQGDTLIHLNQTIKSLHHSLQIKDTELLESHDTHLQLQDKFHELEVRHTSSQAEIIGLRCAVRKVNEDVQNLLKENNKYEHSSTELLRANQNYENNFMEINSLLTKKENEILLLKTENEKLALVAQVRAVKESEKEEKEQQRGYTSPSSPRKGSSSHLELSPHKGGGGGGRGRSSLDEHVTLSPEVSFSPSKSLASNQHSSSALESSLMSRSTPLPVIERPAKKASSSSSQVYYKGVPIEQLRPHSEHMHGDLSDLQSSEPLTLRSSGSLYPNEGSQESLTKKGQPVPSGPSNTDRKVSRSDRLPSITNGGVRQHKKSGSTSEDSGANFVPFGAPRSAFLSSSETPPAPQPQKKSTIVNIRASTSSSSIGSDDSVKRSVQEKSNLIQKIIEESSQRFSSSSSLPSLRTSQQHTSSNAPLNSSHSSDEDSDSVTSRHIQKRNQRRQKKESESGTSSSTVLGEGGQTVKRKKKKHLPVDPFYQKIPCAICGMHFSGDGLKLPHSSASDTLMMENHSQSSGKTTARLTVAFFFSLSSTPPPPPPSTGLSFTDHEILFCTFTCARLWGKVKPYHRHHGSNPHPSSPPSLLGSP